MSPLTFRHLCLLGLLACAGAMAFALYLQHGLGLEPCPLCVFQRVAMIATGIVFLAGAAHGPRGKGRWGYAAFATLAAGAGVGLAGRHVWLQGLPPDQVPACGPTLDYLMGMLPLREVVEVVLKGDGECAKVAGEWLGISLPAWTLIGFVALALLALASPLLARKDSR
jgi:protein dithiol:quinone oxidoreductase